MKFKKLPHKALRTVREVLDQDSEFRERVVSGIEEKDLDRASWLFLTRPEGWTDEYSLLLAASVEEALERESKSAERRLEHLEATHERTKHELADSRTHLASLEAQLMDERDERSRVTEERDALAVRVAELETDRTLVIRNLKAAEMLSVERLARVRILESALEELTDRLETVATGVQGSEVESRSETALSPWEGVDPLTVATSIAAAARSLDEVGRALDNAAAALGVTSDLAGVPVDSEAPNRGADVAAAPTPSLSRQARRSPIRLLRGALEGSRAGIEQILTTPGLVVYVDGYNVSMEAWPSLNAAAQRQSLIDMLGSVAARTRAEIHAVFDGDNDGRRPTVSSPLPVRVHFSHADVEADDQILGYVADLATNRPVLVVSSDNRVRSGARALGANTIASSDLLAFVRGTAL